MIIDNPIDLVNELLGDIEVDFDDITRVEYKLKVFLHWFEKTNQNFQDAFRLIEHSINLKDYYKKLSILTNENSILDIDYANILNNISISLSVIDEINEKYNLLEINWDDMFEDFRCYNLIIKDKTIQTSYFN